MEILEDEQTCIQRRLKEAIKLTSWKTTASFFYNLSWTPLLFRWRLLRPHPAAYNPLIGACKRGLAWYSCLAYLRLMSRDETFLQSFFHINGRWIFFRAWEKHLKSFRCVNLPKSYQWMMKKCEVGPLKDVVPTRDFSSKWLLSFSWCNPIFSTI